MNMLAKFLVTKVESLPNDTDIAYQNLTFMAVTNAPFDPDGNSEDNSFSKWTPSGELKMTVTNPALFGQIKEGEKYYLNFTKAEA